MELLTASASPMQNIRQIPNDIIMMAFEDVAKNMALGTCFRGSFVSSTIYLVIQSINTLGWLGWSLTHVKDTIEAADRKCRTQHSNGESDARISPTRLYVQRLEHKPGIATFGECAESRNDANKENYVTDSTDGFKIVNYSSQRKVEQDRNDNKSNQKKGGVPCFRLI
jgi:hypothetical protein